MTKSKAIIHAAGIQEFTLCGLAFDAHCSGDEERPIIFAEHGMTITCAECRQFIDHVRSSFPRGYKYIEAKR